MAKRHIRYRTRSRGRHYRHAHETHSLLGAIFGGTAAALPFISSNTGTGMSVLEDVVANIQNAQAGGQPQLQYLGMEIKNGVINNIGDMIGLGIAAGAFAWAGRKFKLNKATRISRKWSIF